MSNKDRPTFTLPGSRNLPPPPPIVSAATNPVTDKYPLPWCVGPYGDIWVAADVNRRDDGQWDEQFCPRPRRIAEVANPDDGLAEFIVALANGSGKR